MKTLRSPRSVRKWVTARHAEGKSVALVPTMGALHEGHLSLIKAAVKAADHVIVSIFVNPTQFGPHEDYNTYPRTLRTDQEKCNALGVDLIFAPQPGHMYSETFSTWVNEELLSQHLCGLRRPVHFRGVCTVVLKLFMICQPDVALFGQKDGQQALIIRRMVRDLNIPVKLQICPTIRERDGLAMSSRNANLTETERVQAPVIYAGLQHINSWKRNDLSPAQVRRKLIRFIQTAPDARIDYAVIVDEETLEPVTKAYPGQHLLVAVAVFFGKTRLIDNIRIRW
jgi:pantoate--beta-alanine ligase